MTTADTSSGAPSSGASADVPRETRAPEPPPQAAALFGDRLDAVRRYADLLCDAGVVRGLIGPREVPRIWDRHLLNCAVVEELIPPGASVDDVGSGAGLPGIVLALARPDLEVTLVEPLLRRATFLSEVVEALDLRRVTVVRARAEELARRPGPGVDVVTARAVAPLGRLASWCLPLLRPGGVLLALKGDRAADELATARDELVRAGAGPVDVRLIGAGVIDPPATVVVVPRAVAPAGRGRRSR